MSLKTFRASSFNSNIANENIHGANVLYLRKGSTCIDNRWVHFKDQIIYVNVLIEDFLANKKVFRTLGDIKYVLIALTKNGTITLRESIEEQVSEEAEIKVFENLSDVVPLVLVKLTHDGTSGLTGAFGMKNLTEKDLEVYKGYGNFTTKGEPGVVGVQGPTGLRGAQGIKGVQGFPGLVGPRGGTGLSGVTGFNTLGITGPRGAPGSC